MSSFADQKVRRSCSLAVILVAASGCQTDSTRARDAGSTRTDSTGVDVDGVLGVRVANAPAFASHQVDAGRLDAGEPGGVTCVLAPRLGDSPPSLCGFEHELLRDYLADARRSLEACSELSPPLTVRVEVAINGDGTVRTAAVGPPDLSNEAKRCIEGRVLLLQFPARQSAPPSTVWSASFPHLFKFPD